jgi:hypothetical protein
MMEVILPSETSVITRVTQRNIQEYGILHSHRRENIKSYIHLYVQVFYRTYMLTFIFQLFAFNQCNCILLIDFINY